jgi:hypothetical protein
MIKTRFSAFFWETPPRVRGRCGRSVSPNQQLHLKSSSYQRERSRLVRRNFDDTSAILAISLHEPQKMRKILTEMIVHTC